MNNTDKAAEMRRLRLAVDELNVAVVEWDHAAGTFYSSPAFARYALSQTKAADLLHFRAPADALHPDDLPKLADYMRSAETATRVETVLRLKLVAGGYCWCRLIGFFERDETGARLRTTGLIVDVNEEREHSFMLGRVLSDLPGGVGIFSLTDRLRCAYYSDGFAALSGRTRAEIDALLDQGTLLRTLIVPGDYQDVLAALRKSVAAGQPIDMNYRYVHLSGEIRWGHLSASKLREEDGVPIYYCVFGNPSEESSLFRSAVEDSSSGVFVASRQTRQVLYMNSAIGDLFGVSRELLRRRIDRAENVSSQFVFLTQAQVDALREDAVTELHTVWQDRLYLRVRAKALRWNGVDAYIMYFDDETAQKTRQQELQRLINEVPAGIGIYDVKDGHLLLYYLNDAYYAMLGVSRESRKRYLGAGTIDAVAPEDRTTILEAMRSLRAGANKTTVRYRVLRGDGTYLWLSLSASVVERQGDDLRLYAAFSDCDDMMRAQQELANNRARLEAALDSAQVLEWRYDFASKTVTNSGSMGIKYHWPRVIEHVDQLVQRLEERGQVHPDSVPDFRWLYDHCGDGKRISRELRYRAADGTRYLWLRVIFSPQGKAGGASTEVIGTAVDVTEQREREQRYEEQLRLKQAAGRDALATAYFNLTRETVMESETELPRLSVLLGRGDVDAVLRSIREDPRDAGQQSRFAPVRDCAAMCAAFAAGSSHVELRHHLLQDPRWVQSCFDMIQNPYTGDVEAIAVLRDVSDSVRGEQVVQRLLAVDYQTIMTIDAATGLARPLRSTDTDDTLLELMARQSTAGAECGDGVEQFLRAHVIPADVERAVRENQLDTIIRQLADKPLYESLYALQSGEQLLHKRALYAYLEDDHAQILCAIQDVTETYEQEEQQKQALAQALHAAEEASRSKSEFLARMSHDMRTPMNGILGLAELSAGEQTLEELRESMAQVKASGAYLLSLINDTLDFQRIESGKMKLRCEIVSNEETFRSMLDMIRPAAEEKSVELRVVNRNVELNWYVYLDPVRTKQIFINLLSNAIKFTPPGGTVILEMENLSREGMISHNRFRIIDSGIGMSEDFVRNRLFRPFEQEQSEISSQYAGSGLGLSIVRSLVEMMGGQITVESALGRGTTFTVLLDFLRIDPAQAQAELDKKSSEQSVSLQKLEGKRFLLAEDHPLNAQIAVKLLERAKCSAVWRSNGQKAVETFAQSAPGFFAAILMDIRMPVMDGLEAAKAIRALPRPDAATIPIIAMTANAYDEDVRKSLEVGMNAHLAKPIEPAKFYGALVKWIGQDA